MKPKKQNSYHHGDLRRTLIDVSIDAINQHGVDALNLRALATRAGVSSGAPYHHFADRADLLAVIALEGFQRFKTSLVTSRDAAAPTASARLAALGQAYVQFAIEHTGYFRVMFRGDTHGAEASELSITSQEAFQLVVQAILDCQAEGTAPSGDPQPLVLTAWSLMHGLATLYVDGTLPKAELDAGQLSPLVASLASQMFAALAAEQSRPPKQSPKAGARRRAV